MKLIVGLGNPGSKYKGTRHNIGFNIIKKLADMHDFFSTQRCDSIIGEGKIRGQEVVLAQPLTYMNRSGKAVNCLVRKYNLDLKDLLIVYDDLNLDVGRIRLKTSGSSGGHNGLKSIINHLSSNQFPRLKIGIGRPEPGFNIAEYVLDRFKPEEREVIEEAIEVAVKAVMIYIESGPEAAMNKFN
ncbi:aminoacyl-tRNA hydrolase [Halanaerobiaceae bacterium Z-7014]|uniref:Peptidyl-tRNA hydrolase n=1 Tax=Halonatronomonas betaini TaxID=2778430 RepID=A0A931AVI4_9FIRM|nr:aminoacyl-tRNA hydrolase [Halonatronomonas betaini]MBF8437255.1 aminoacyl-tRNA hydrolase [Halonatronomonas betaini]